MKRLLTALLSLLFFLVPVSGCSSGGNRAHSVTVLAMDTAMDLTVYGDAGFLDDAEALIRRLERTLSVTDAGSDLYRLNHGQTDTVGVETAGLLLRALELSAGTDGALDPTVYPIVRAWGFTTGEYRVPDAEEIAGLLPLVGYRAIRVTNDGCVTRPEGAEIDLGAVAKGYTGAQLAKLCRESGVTGAIFNLGGNVQTVGTKPDGSLWKIAIADPNGGEGYAGILTVGECAVVTSGGYERYFERDGMIYRHIMDPSTGYPAQSGLISVTVIGQDGTLCDALSTAIYVMGLDRAIDLWRASEDFEAILMTETGEIYATEGIAGQFAPSGAYRGREVTVIGRG